MAKITDTTLSQLLRHLCFEQDIGQEATQKLPAEKTL